MAGQDYADLLYDMDGGLPSLAKASEEAASKGGARINVLLLYSRSDPAKELPEWSPDGRCPDTIRRGSKTVLTLNEHGNDPIRIAVVRSKAHPNVYYALSDCPAADFKARFVQFVGKHIPTLSRMRLSNAEMRSIVRAASKVSDVRIRFVSVRSRRPDLQGFDSRMDHIDKPAKEFTDADEGRGEEIRTVRIACMPSGLVKNAAAAGPAILTMTRDCRFSARRSTGVLFDTILPHAADLAARRGEKLLASAKTADQRTPEPLIVHFGRRVFIDPKKNEGHIDAIASMPHTAVNKHHTNPYIHVSLVDYMDCSSYDIWVLVSDKLAIIPKFFASDASMGRLVNHIMDKFGDATIEEYDGG